MDSHGNYKNTFLLFSTLVVRMAEVLDKFKKIFYFTDFVRRTNHFSSEQSLRVVTLW